MVSRNEVIAVIEAHLAGRLTADGLAAWAFDRFYAEELADTESTESADEVIAAVLDDLMFADDPHFALDEADLRNLIVRLQKE